ncbi:jg22111 [Pararge aegeria aegeria]|uniref:Jg22111 protein n=1 Tax=Pararge aegeria aegeria TaxID=348720 RepID=A0A8S4QM93_9NEOP|nr:jg22111 [Pararge aegeria aegeria]
MVNSRVQDILRGGIKKVGRNRICVEFNSPAAANSFLNNPLLAANQYEAVIPSFNITRMGIVRGVPSDLSLADFVKDAEVPSGCGEILKARRLNRKVSKEGRVEWVPTGTVVITFSGQVLPHRIFCCYTAMSVEIYQVADQCRSKPKCYKCAQEHVGKNCSTTESLARCLFCSGKHFATSQSCPEQTRQKSIKSTMSQENISYSEACERYPPVSRTYSDAARSNPSQNLTVSSPAPPSTHSYRKTTTTPRSPRRPSPQGYDRLAHQSIIADRDPPPSSNGTVLQPQGPALPTFSLPSSSDNLLDVLLTLLINMFSKMNDFPLPPNVANKLSEFLNIIKIPLHPME